MVDVDERQQSDFENVSPLGSMPLLQDGNLNIYGRYVAWKPVFGLADPSRCNNIMFDLLLQNTWSSYISEALKGHSNESRFPCQPQGCVPSHYAKRCVALFIHLFACYNINWLSHYTKLNSYGTGTLMWVFTVLPAFKKMRFQEECEIFFY